MGALMALMVIMVAVSIVFSMSFALPSAEEWCACERARAWHHRMPFSLTPRRLAADTRAGHRCQPVRSLQDQHGPVHSQLQPAVR